MGKHKSGRWFIWMFSVVGMTCNLQAQSGLKEGLKFSTERKADSMQVIQEVHISREIHSTGHDEDLEYRHAERAIELSLGIGDTLLYAKALDNLGLLYRYHQRYQEAIPLHIKAHNLIKNTPEKGLAHMIYANNAGVACRYAQEFDQAVFYYMYALSIARQQNDLRNIAISSNGLGNTLLHLPGREDDALAYFEQALKAEEERGNTLGVAMNYLSISDYYNEKEDYLTARDYLDKLVRINTARKDVFGLAITYQYLGLNYAKEGKDPDKAKHYYVKSLELFVSLGNTHKQAELLKHLGDVSKHTKNYASAIDYYRESMDLATDSKNNGLLMSLHYQLSDVYEEQSDPVKALAHYKISQQYKDSVDLRKQETEIAAIENRYALEKKESQITLLKKDKVLNQAQLESQRVTLKSQKYMLLLLFIGLLAIAVTAMMQYRNIKIKKKSNQLLTQRNQQIINQRDEISLQKDKIEEVNKQLEKAFAEIIDQQKKNEARRIKLIESKFENKIQSLTLQSLESQMNPHFLFNGMNAVRYLVIQGKKEAAMQYLNTFAQLLRLSLTNNRKHVIPLEEELRTTSLYLEIEKLRFSSSFEFSIHVSPDVHVNETMVPPKILQPLAENAVKHGLLPSRKEEKKLAIHVARRNGVISVEMTDNGTGIKRKWKEAGPREDGTHLGLKLIQERLAIYNKQNENMISFYIEPIEDPVKGIKGTKAGIRISREQKMAAV